ncbi:MAG TPA: DUF1697 domain-containing protein [Blastocatellia bacterium]|nr:DUF1697 domain-containing protein [Blastocatellia bacterium]
MALVVFLRGVNVGGHKTFQPSVLAKDLVDLDVVNVGAAGTFVVRKPIGQAKLRTELLRRLPFKTEIIICAGRDIINLISSDPFANEPSGADVVHFVTVLAKRPNGLPSLPFTLPEDDEWLVKVIAIRDRFLLGLYRRQMRTISLLGRIDKRLDVSSTTRNWNTINAIARILEGGGAKR